jgi:hypothetical protein
MVSENSASLSKADAISCKVSKASGAVPTTS